MAKARDIPGLHASMPFAEAAAATVAVRAEELFENAEGVLDTSVLECVHDMRVATRRLRAVLEIYAPCFPKAEDPPLLRGGRPPPDAPGPRRAPGVLLDRRAGLEGVLPKADAPGIEAFAAPVREEQERGNATLAQALEHAESTALRDRLRLLAASAVEREPPPEADAEAAREPEPEPLAAATGPNGAGPGQAGPA